ncbi:radical SAM family heme chaperone HemW [Labilibaculum sp.]|uniref:radical SAM family heme chaperone HemW n=1 Tax=Labilibaculum sp. TaxID=2060723 RepID=UPI002AA648E2|nr:radical SAM family heme chaperone HemW [Labilibaculum sp.]
MSGVYFHIPFCKQLCHYCAFHKSISLQAKDDMLECLKLELKLRKGYLGDTSLNTIYFGGGTPSVYQPKEIESLIDEVAKYFTIDANAEITLEANPDDLTEKYLQELSKTRVNRLSVGIQSFHDEDLILMNRRHTGKEAFEAIRRAQSLGFDNISVDQIYGVPGLSMEKWKENLDLVFDLDVQHISSYHLMYDPNTIFTKKLEKGQLVEMDEEESFEQFNYLIDEARKHGFIHYEISNFSKEGYISKHNSSYWKQKKYLGIGPSAHSYNLEQREWNIANNYKYIKAIREGESFSEKEELSEYDRFNDFVLTSLRTYWGMDLELVRKDFGEELYQHCVTKSKKYLLSDHVRQENNCIILNDKGVFVSNDIMSDFFWIDEE